MTTLQPADAYRLLAQGYDTGLNPMLTLEQRIMTPLLPPLRGAKVIDAAAGTGRWASHCQSRGARTIAADCCLEMLASARGPAVLADVHLLPLPDGFSDLTICAFALGYAPDCLPELARVTRTGGIVLVSDVHPEAIRSGWTRTFRHPTGAISIAHHPYSLDDVHARKLRLDCLIEPRFGEPECALFAQAGKAAAFDEVSRQPAIFVARWIKV